MASIYDIWVGDIIPQSGVDVAVGRNSLDFPSPVVPLLDVHLRRAEFHDSGAPTHSGIVSFHSDKNRLELIPSNSGAQPIVTAVLWDGYDTTGGTTVNTNVTVTIDTERVNTHPDIFVFNGVTANHVQINASGTYEFTYSVSLDSTSTTRSVGRAWIRRSVDGGSSFAEVTASRSFIYCRTTAAGEGTGSAKVILDVEVGHIFGLRATNWAGGNLSTIADASRFTIRKLA